MSQPLNFVISVLLDRSFIRLTSSRLRPPYFLVIRLWRAYGPE